jgi:nucleotide-binding universal stress UspA family protein
MIPPRAILAPVDFSDTARAALVLAARLAQHCGADLHVLYVEDPLLVAAANHAGIRLGRETHEELQRFIAGAWPAAQCSPQSHVIAGAPVDVILDVAHQHRADLVVVSSCGMSGAARLVFGSTTEGLLRRTDVSVLIAPAEWMPPHPDALDLSGLGPLVVMVDLSDDPSISAAKAACKLASILGSSVEIVPVVPDLAVQSRWRAHADTAVRERVAAARQEIELLIRGLGRSVAVEMRVEASVMPSQLAEAAGRDSDRAPILVLGKKATGSTRARSGATAYRALSMATVPVLMHVAGHNAWT